MFINTGFSVASIICFNIDKSIIGSPPVITNSCIASLLLHILILSIMLLRYFSLNTNPSYIIFVLQNGQLLPHTTGTKIVESFDLK